MKSVEFIKSKLKTYLGKVKLQQTGYTSLIDVTVTARNPEMARRLIKQLYGASARVSNVKEIR